MRNELKNTKLQFKIRISNFGIQVLGFSNFGKFGSLVSALLHNIIWGYLLLVIFLTILLITDFKNVYRQIPNQHKIKTVGKSVSAGHVDGTSVTQFRRRYFSAAVIGFWFLYINLPTVCGPRPSRNFYRFPNGFESGNNSV